MAVRLRVGDRGRGERAAGTGARLDHHGLAPGLLQMLSDHARHGIGARPDDEADRLGRKCLRRGALVSPAQQERDNAKTVANEPWRVPSKWIAGIVTQRRNAGNFRARIRSRSDS